MVFSLGIGPWISVGWNGAGLSLTGNELAPNDERVGVPRLLMVREQLTARTLDEAVAMALRPDRASSYNTVFAHRDGRVVNVEGSATDAESSGPSAAGRWPTRTTTSNGCSATRATRRTPGAPRAARAGLELLAGAAAAAPGTVTPALLRAWLADHAARPTRSVATRRPRAGAARFLGRRPAHRE